MKAGRNVELGLMDWNREAQLALEGGLQPPFDPENRLKLLEIAVSEAQMWRFATAEGSPDTRGRCFGLAMGHEHTYVEGVAEQQGWWFHHAWVLLPDGTLYDPSWRNSGTYYLGTPFTKGEVSNYHQKGPSESLLWASEAQFLAQVHLGESILDNWYSVYE